MADNQHSLATYVSDMLALEEHIQKPFDTQLNDGDFAKYAEAKQIATRLSALAQKHVAALKEALDELGGHELAPVKDLVTNLEGFVAGAIDKMRKTKVSKSLRDDYTALSLCSASYTMLNATANAMGDATIAALAATHLRDYAQCVMEIGNALPGVTILELQETGLTVETGTIERSRQTAEDAWRSGATATAR